MNITLGYARTVLAQYADSGYCPSDDRVRDCINNAIQRLVNKNDVSDALLCRMRFCVSGGCITLPREVAHLVKVNICNVPTAIHNRWYEFLNSGVGSMDFQSTSWVMPVDMGDGFRLHTDIITPRNILVTCDVAEGTEDEPAYILIRGNDENGKEVFVDGEAGERIQLDNVNPRYSTKKFSCVTSVVKPITNGYVYLSAYDPDNPSTRYDIATYHPYEERPSYRRYYMTGCDTSNYTTVIALAKLRFIPAMHDSDTLLVQNIPALQSMMQAINYYNAGDVNLGKEYETMATRYYLEQIESERVGTTNIEFMPGFAPGEVQGIM